MSTDRDEGFRIIQIASSYSRAKVAQSAVEVGVFDLLADGPAAKEAISEKLGIHPRLSRDFLDALVALGLLNRTGEEYSNGAAADRTLVKGRPGYVGGFIELSAVLYGAWAGFTETLRRGGPPPEYNADDLFGEKPRDPEFFRTYVEGMDATNKYVAPEVAARVPWDRWTSFVDVGGCRGNLASMVVKEHPHLQGGVFDVTPTEAYFHEHMKTLGTADKVVFHAGNFFVDDLPKADVIVMGHVLHDWSPEQRRMLIGKAFDAVPPGGAVVVYDRMIDDERTNILNLLISLNMAIGTAGGSEYLVGDCRRWMEEAGFVFTSAEPLPSHDILMIAEKPA